MNSLNTMFLDTEYSLCYLLYGWYNSGGESEELLLCLLDLAAVMVMFDYSPSTATKAQATASPFTLHS